MIDPDRLYASEGIEIADMIGDPMLADMAADVIVRFEEQGVLVHGVKRPEYVGSVALNGVAPITPECEQGSCWTTGTRIFIDSSAIGSMRGYDTSFFHYAGGALALTTLSALSARGIVVPENRERDHTVITLNQTVPPSAIELVVATPLSEFPDLSGRQRGEAAERAMLHKLAQIATDGLRLGHVSKASIRP